MTHWQWHNFSLYIFCLLWFWNSGTSISVISLLLPLRCSAPLFIHKRSLTDLCVPTIQPVPAQQGPLLLRIIPESNLLLIYNKLYFLRINPRKTKSRKLINRVRMFGLFFGFLSSLSVFKVGALQSFGTLPHVCQLSNPPWTCYELRSSSAITQPSCHPQLSLQA